MDENKNFAVSDNTVIASLGLLDMDFSLTTLSERGPNAASTAVPVKQRDQYLLSEANKENEYLQIMKMFPDRKTEEDETVLHVRSENIPQDFSEFLDYLASSKTLENKVTEGRESSSSRTSSGSGGSDLYPGSSILRQSHLLSFNDEEDEVDVMKGLPSYLIGGTPEGVIEIHEEVWGDDDTELAEEIHSQELETPDLINEVDLRTIKTSLSNRSETPSHLPLILCTDSDTGYDDRPEESEGILISEEENAVDVGEFHSINFREFSLDEEQAAIDAKYEIDGSSFADKSDFSGYINPDDVSVRPSMWSIVSDGLETSRKPSIEDIFALKSEKFESLTGEMNCPFDKELVGVAQNDQYVEGNHLFQTFRNTDSSSAREEKATSILNAIENDTRNIPSDSFERSVPFQGSFVSNEYTSSIPGFSESTTSSQTHATNTNCQTPSAYMAMLHQIIERAVKSGSDPKHLVDEMLRNTNRDITNSESLMETSTDVLEMRMYREQLKATSCTSRPDLRTETTENRQSVGTTDQEQVVGRGLKMGTSLLQHSSATLDSLQHTQQNRSQAIPSLVHSTLATSLSAGDAQDHFVIARSSLTGIRTSAECTIRNPTAQTRIVSVSKLDESFKLASSTPFRESRFYSFNFKPTYLVNPNSYTRLSFCFCSFLPGLFSARLELNMYELGAQETCISSRVIEFTVDVHRPDVGIVCENSSCVDFGLVPEYCLAQKEVELINNSDDPLPVLIELKSMHGSTDILSWGNNHPHLKYLSPSLAAVELPAKVSIRVVVQARAPGINFFNANGIIEATSKLEMRLDSPYSMSPILTEAPIKIRIGEVLLRTFRNKLPLTVESEVGKFGSSTFTLRNKSLFPLDLRFKIIGNESLGVSPEQMSIPSQEDASVQINFTPSSRMGQAEVEGKIVIKVNPEGLEMDLPIRAHSSLPHSSEKAAVKWPPSPNIAEEILETKPLINEKMRLSCNTHTLVFGTVPVGESSSQTLILQNEWSGSAMSLQLTVKDSEAFYLKVPDEREKVFSKIVEILPKEKLTMEVYFAPSETEIYRGSIECRCMGVTIPSKSTFPLYGFGGCGELRLKYEENILSEESGFLLDHLVPRALRLMKPSCCNEGSRSIFVKFRFVSDKLEQPLSWSDISIEPTEFILKPGEKKELLMMVTGAASFMERVPGTIARLQVIYGDEILRRRFRRISDKTIKWKKIKDIRLLKINFEDRILREEMFTETELDSSFPQDPVIFYNSCRVSSIPLTVERDNREISVTMVDVSLDQNTLCFANGSNQTIRGVSEEVAPINLAAKAAEFDVIPAQLRLKSSQKGPVDVSVVNYGEEDQILEVLCEKQWLSITPREATVPPKSFTIFKVQPLTVNIPQNIPKLSQASFKILGKNDEKEIRVTLEIDTPIFVDKYSHISKIPSLMRRPSESAVDSQRSYTKGAVSVDHLKKASQDQQRIVSRIEVSDEVKFPPTRIFEESYAKLIIKNMDQRDYQMKVVARCQHFAVPFTESFLVKSQRRVEVTIFFRPRRKGELVDTLSVVVNDGQQSYTVRLDGQAL